MVKAGTLTVRVMAAFARVSLTMAWRRGHHVPGGWVGTALPWGVVTQKVKAGVPFAAQVWTSDQPACAAEVGGGVGGGVVGGAVGGAVGGVVGGGARVKAGGLVVNGASGVDGLGGKVGADSADAGVGCTAAHARTTASSAVAWSARSMSTSVVADAQVIQAVEKTKRPQNQELYRGGVFWEEVLGELGLDAQRGSM